MGDGRWGKYRAGGEGLGQGKGRGGKVEGRRVRRGEGGVGLE